jgi:hypothetical protein
MSDNFFDPTDLEIEIDTKNGETGELLPPKHTPESAWSPDTNGDPEGSERRATQDDIILPDYFYKKYMLDNEGKPTFNPSRIFGIMKIFNEKIDTEQTFNKDDDALADKEREYFNLQVEQIVLGQKPLLEVDPQTTGINFLQLATRTWAEFVSIVYEYKESMAEQDPTKEIPEWLIEREDKMLQLGRKARLLKTALAAIDSDFGLKNVSIDEFRVKTQVELRLQRLAEWNYNNVVDTSIKSAMTMTKQANEAMDLSDVA